MDKVDYIPYTKEEIEEFRYELELEFASHCFYSEMDGIDFVCTCPDVFEWIDEDVL